VPRAPKPVPLVKRAELRSHLNRQRCRTQRRLERATWSRFPADSLVSPTMLRRFLHVWHPPTWKQVLLEAGVELEWEPKKPGMPPHYVGLTSDQCRRVMTAFFLRYGALWRRKLNV
jgi:hypothetical protein